MIKTINNSIFYSTNKISRKIAWDSESHFDLLSHKKYFNTKRSYERWIEKNEFFPPIIKLENYIIDNKEKVKLQFFKRTLKQYEDKRTLILFIQLHKIDKQFILFANDRRGGRRWALITSDSQSEILKGLESLSLRLKKSFVCIPDIKISEKFFLITEDNKNFDIKFKSKFICHIPIYLFYNSLPSQNKIKYSNKNISNNSYLNDLESESIQIMREVVSEAENPVMLYSIGKDSSVMLHLAKKAFYPSLPPFPLMHVDTRWKFKEMYSFRKHIVEETGMKLITHINPEGVKKNINPLTHGSSVHTDIMKTQGLKQAMDKYKFDVAFGGARRDEEKSRAKERIFSFRTPNHQWDPKNQRPELWNLYNSSINKGESIRVFPLSNWTELDIWQYIYQENIPIVPLYYAKMRPVIERNKMLIMVDDDRLDIKKEEKILLKKIRFRTLGCYPLTGAIESDADTLETIVLELLKSKTSEREGRAIDNDSSSSMEKKKLEGYF